MHMRGEPGTMQDAPLYDDVVAEVHEFLRERVEAAIFAGIDADQLCVDPGIGFGKTLEHNLRLLRDRCGGSATSTRPCSSGPRASGSSAP